MSTNITGWVEINTINESTEDLWFKVIEIDILVEQNYSIFGRLFGVRAKENEHPIAANRGLPKGVFDSNIQEFSYNSVVGITWADYEEIAVPLKEMCQAPYTLGWEFILNSMDQLSRRYGEGNVRLIVGFDNYG